MKEEVAKKCGRPIKFTDAYHVGARNHMREKRAKQKEKKEKAA